MNILRCFMCNEAGKITFDLKITFAGDNIYHRKFKFNKVFRKFFLWKNAFESQTKQLNVELWRFSIMVGVRYNEIFGNLNSEGKKVTKGTK